MTQSGSGDSAVDDFDPLARPLAPVDQGADHIDFGWCGRAECGCGHDYLAGVPAHDADYQTLYWALHDGAVEFIEWLTQRGQVASGLRLNGLLAKVTDPDYTGQ